MCVKWQSMKTAPRDGRLVLLDVGMYFPLYGFYRPERKKWTVAAPNADLPSMGFIGFRELDIESEESKAWAPVPTTGEIDHDRQS